MKEFNPPLSERNTTELIIIAFSSTDEWQKGAILKAKSILKNRGLSKKEQVKLFEEITKLKQGGWKIEMERRAIEDYSLIEMVFMFLNIFRTIFQDWTLRKEGYVLKAKRRLQIIFLSIIFFGLLFSWVIINPDNLEQKRIDEIKSHDITDWKKEHGYE